MSGNVKISVIVPLYNEEKYVDKCIESILNQSFKDFEAIIIEDCSTDNSLEKAKKWSEKDDRIRLIQHEKNMGLSLTRNQGMDESVGEYIVFLDSDDWIEENHLYNLYRTITANNADVVGTGYKEYDASYNLRKDYVLFNKVTHLPTDCLERMKYLVGSKLIATACSKMYRKSFLVDNNLRFENIYVEDVLFHFALLYHVKSYIIIPTSSYCYYMSPNSITRGSSIEKASNAMRIVIKFSRLIDSYIRKMPEIMENEEMRHTLRYYFAFIGIKGYVLGLMRGLNYKDFLSSMYNTFEEECPELSPIMIFFFEKYLYADNIFDKMYQLDKDARKDKNTRRR